MWMQDLAPDPWASADLMGLPVDAYLDYSEGYLNEDGNSNLEYRH